MASNKISNLSSSLITLFIEHLTVQYLSGGFFDINIYIKFIKYLYKNNRMNFIILFFYKIYIIIKKFIRLII